jgi:hypothetical protein
MLDISVSVYGKSKPTGYEPLVFEETPAVRHPSEPPPSFTDSQHKLIDSYVALVPKADRAAYLAAVDVRFGSGAPGTAAVRAACIAAMNGYLPIEELRARGLAPMPTNRKKDEVEAE